MAVKGTMQVWDIFCRVVDNYGDAGVTWRLARQLAAEHGVAPRLWIDEPAALARMCPGLDLALPVQTIEKVELRHWTTEAATAADAIAAVVIEAFACELPPAYATGMAGRVPPPVWINLEYLSAEDWVEGAHKLASPQARAGDDQAPIQQVLNKYFFFPGFTPATGGLLRERGLMQVRAKFQADPAAQAVLWRALGVPPREEAPAGELRVSLFAYENPVLPALLAAWAAGDTPLRCMVPEGRVLPQVAAFFGVSNAKPGIAMSRGRLAVHVLPFTDQPGYDRLLWACDLNFVRGEDSFVRAQWAARPFVWQIYPQAEAAHHAKLAAFWQRYRDGLPEEAARAMLRLWRGWNGIAATDCPEAWAGLMQQQPALEFHAEDWAARCATQTDLAAQLVEFAAKVPGFAV
jgi:uncharacterized repeat protein (TIGR03837 family)